MEVTFRYVFMKDKESLNCNLRNKTITLERVNVRLGGRVLVKDKERGRDYCSFKSSKGYMNTGGEVVRR